MSEDKFPKQLFSQEWNIKPGKDRQRKTVIIVTSFFFFGKSQMAGGY